MTRRRTDDIISDDFCDEVYCLNSEFDIGGRGHKWAIEKKDKEPF